MHRRVLSSVPDFCPLDASGTPQSGQPDVFPCIVRCPQRRLSWGAAAFAGHPRLDGAVETLVAGLAARSWVGLAGPGSGPF